MQDREGEWERQREGERESKREGERHKADRQRGNTERETQRMEKRVRER
jgi:hypothetical protein